MSVNCRECGAGDMQIIGANQIGRPVWICPNGHKQAGPFPTSVN